MSDGGEQFDKPPARKEHRWVAMRIILGLAQVIGASASLTLLIVTGVNAWSLAGVMITSILTAVSVLVFGSRPQRHRDS